MKGIRTGVFGLALSSFVANATAAELCATAQDLTAMQVAAVQQKLMVAALSCNDSALYNDFVASYQDDLVASDQRLQAFFMRLNAETGAADYDSFKTKLANTYSLRSGGNTRGYCGTARTTFKAALVSNRPSLRSFVLSQPMPTDARYAVCGETVAGGSVLMEPVRPAVAAAKDLVAGKATAQAAVAAVSDVPGAKSAGAVTADAAAATASVAAASNSKGTAPPPQTVRRYDARDSRTPYAYPNSNPNPTYAYPSQNPTYRQGYDDYYGYTTRYGERDPYYRNPYSRPQYRRVPPEYYYYYWRR